MPRSAAAELDAAGIVDPDLRAAYGACRTLNAVHGRTYFLATRLLPIERRPAVHALYGFARSVDDIVDDVHDLRSPADRAAQLDRVAADLAAALRGRGTQEPVLAALADTAARYGIADRHFTDFMTSMRMDTHVTGYATHDDLAVYVHGSAAVIGLQMLPVLGTVVPRAEAEPAAAALGTAFQLTNFLRDVGEDLDRGRVYLPADELAAFGVDRDLLARCRRERRADGRVRRAMAHFGAQTREIYRRAEPGIALLEPAARDCVRCAFVLYQGILDEIEAADYDVLHRRVAVSNRRRLAVALPGLARAAAARIGRGGRRERGPGVGVRP